MSEPTKKKLICECLQNKNMKFVKTKYIKIKYKDDLMVMTYDRWVREWSNKRSGVRFPTSPKLTKLTIFINIGHIPKNKAILLIYIKKWFWKKCYNGNKCYTNFLK
jgi:hypothetical protein